MHTITYAAHTAHLDAMTGEGLLVLPHPSDDLRAPDGLPTLHEADWDGVMHDLDRGGWQLAEDEDEDGWAVVGETVDGRTVLALYGREPVTSMPSMAEQANALAALSVLAGMTVR